MAKTKHAWKFFRAGGVDQVALSTGADLANLHALDQKLWVALACPIEGVEIDARSLALLDVDGDGRIRPPEILAAIDWLKEVLRDLGDLFEPSDEVPLASISADTPLGKDVLAGAKLILTNLGKPDARSITLADVSDTEKIFVATKLNGDGIVPPESAGDEETARAISDVMSAVGSVPDRSGKPGVDQAHVDAFFDQASDYARWADGGAAARARLGEATDAAAEAFGAVKAKVTDYFARCRLAAFDVGAAAALNPSEAELTALSSRVLTSDSPEMAALPLARVEADRALPLDDGVNPAWAARIAAFARLALTPILGGASTSLDERSWETVCAALADYEAWQAAKPATQVTKLDGARILELAGGDQRARITKLIVDDAALATESKQIEAAEKLVRCRRDFLVLLQNFVNFSQFYGKRRAIFQAGTLYLDARSCDLCLPVTDAARHALLAGMSQSYLVYCDCVRRKAPQEKRTIVAAVTSGETDNLMVGRNGVFYDRKGDDWDATVTKLVENPIGIRQAFWAPYKRFIRLVEEQVAKRAMAADAEQGKKMEAAATEVTSEPKKEEAAKAPPKEEKGIDVGTVAAIGVAVGGIATFFSSILATFLGLGMWMPFGVLALLLAVSGPSMLIAWLKLRQRNVGPLLDANGWAVNALARINVPFGTALTSLAVLPEGASRSLRDPFAEKRRPWAAYSFAGLLAVAAGAWFLGKLDTYLPDRARVTTVLHRAPPPAASAASAK